MSAANIGLSEYPVGDLGGVLSQNRDELEWLAYFLTADRNVAAACVIDVCGLAESENPGFQGWLSEWSRLATIRGAVQIHQRRMAQLSSRYAQGCSHGAHSPLSADSVEVLVDESTALMERLDVLCRFALVVCGLEKRSASEAALLLGIDQTSAEGAYCTAIGVLEVMGCEQFQRQNNFAAVYN